MTRIFNFSPLTSFAKDESGATAIEYGLFAALIAAVIVGSVATLGTETNSGFSNVANEMTSAREAAEAAAAAAEGEGG